MKMNRFGLDDSRDDSSLDSEHSPITRMNSSFIKLPSMPSMYSPESKASSHASVSSSSSPTANTNSEIDYDRLPDEIKDLFEVIDSYDPVELELETPLKCFLPPYIPSVGNVDACIHIPRPDGVPDGIGTAVLDEPIPTKQSNAAVIELQLRNHSKTSSSKGVSVRSINNAAENANEIDQWIQSVEEVQATKPPPEVRYPNKMPMMQELMQAWPKEIEDDLRNGTVELPSGDIDLSVDEYARMMCLLLGIPVYEGRVVESVHVLLSMFVEMQDSNDVTRPMSL